MLNWDAIGAVGEVLGAIAVFITLAYIAIQVRASNKLLLFQYRESSRAAEFEVSQQEIHDREFAELLFRAETDPSSLDEVDLRRVTKHVRNDLIHRHAMFLRGVSMNDDRVQFIAINSSAQMVRRFSFAKEMLTTDLWDRQFVAKVYSCVEEGDANS